MNLEPKTFTGLLIPAVPIKPTDYVQGDPKNPLAGLGKRVVNATGKWADYRPPLQIQYDPKSKWDTSDCTGFAYCRDIATFLNYLWRNNLLPQEFIDWAKQEGYIQQDSFLFDPRVLGIMAGTTGAGNWLQVVADAARKGGLLPANTLPGADGIENYDVYYDKKLITPEITALGLEFLKWVDLPYQWVTDGDVAGALKACPLYVALCTCGGWNTPPVPWCNAGNNSNHAVVEVQDQEILDSYPPDLKPLSADYNIPYRMMILTSIKEQQTMQKTIGFKKVGNATIYVQVGSCLIPVADWTAFTRLGGDSNSVVTLADSEFAKFNIVNGDLFKSS